MRDYGHGPDDRTGDKLMRSLPQRQNRGRPVHLPLFAAIANDPFITPTPSQLPQKCSPQCRKFPLDTNAPDKWVMWQMGGVGPMFGQVGFLNKFAGKAYED